MAKKFGIEDEKIAEAIERIKPIKHRLELINSANGITIIDDSYNCNIDGAVAAFEVLRDFCGRKVIFSQGIVELGDEEQVVRMLDVEAEMQQKAREFREQGAEIYHKV